MKISGKVKETIGVAAVMLGVVVMQWDLWVSGKRMLSHDSIIWFGAFSYFADCLHRGFLPLWNPYMNCGEIFFLNMHVLHLWDPSMLILVFAGNFLKINALTIYHCDLLFRYLIFISGGYLFFRRLAKYKFSAFVAFITLSFSALCSSYLKQHAFMLSFYLLPWILLFTFKFLEERNSMPLLWLAFLGGVALCSYHAMYLISSVVILLMCIFLSKGFALPKSGNFLKDRKFVLVALFVFLLLSINLLPVFLTYTYETVPTARLFEAPMAASSLPADFFNLFAPYSFMLHFFDWFYMSESFLYIGLLPFFFAIVGLFYSRHRYRKGFAFAAAIIALLMLGPKFFVSSLFSDFFPFFKIIRNTHTFSPFLIFCLAYFTCLGVDVVSESMENAELNRYKKKFMFIAIFISGAALLITHHVLSIYRPLIEKSRVVFDIVSSFMSQDLNTALKEIFSRSYYNALLFIACLIALLHIMTNPKTSLMFKRFTIVAFILADLVIFNLVTFEFVTIDRVDLSLWPKEAPGYSDYRTPIIWPKYPFFGFTPAMQRKFTAVSSNKTWLTTHFYEMKAFFNFVNNGRIPLTVKEVFMGISAPKLKLVSAAVVLPPDRQVEECIKLNSRQINSAIFIEEDPPQGFTRLKAPLKDINDVKLIDGKIKVVGFDPNGIVVKVDLGQDGFLYYSDGFDKSWRAFIDGKETRVYRTNMAFKSVIVGKGTHIVRFVYDPRLYKGAIFCYFLGILIAAVVLIYAVLKKKINTHGKNRQVLP